MLGFKKKTTKVPVVAIAGSEKHKDCCVENAEEILCELKQALGHVRENIIREAEEAAAKKIAEKADSKIASI